MAKWLSDKELEEIYRKGSEAHDFEYRADAWSDMEHLLDKDQRFRGAWIGLASIVGMIILGYFALQFSNRGNDDLILVERQLEQKVQEESVPTSPVTLTSTNNTHTDDESITSTDDTEVSNNQNTSNLKSSAYHERVSSTDQIRTTSTGELSNTHWQDQEDSNYKNPISNTFAGSTQKLDNISQNDNSNNNLGKATNERTTGLSFNDLLNDHSESGINQSSSQLDKIENTLTRTNQSLSLTPLSITQLNKIHSNNINQYHLYQLPEIENDTDIKDKFRRFLFSGTLGVETSWTPNGDFSSLDYSFGLRTSYFATSRLGFSLGASYQKDIYVAQKGDYNSPGFWEAMGASGAPEWTNANCNMLEISLGTSYSFGHRDQNGLSIGADLISNFMLQESYDFFFVNENENFTSSWNMANNTLLNAISLSSNYRAHISDNWLVEGGPYVRLPLTGIGHGNIELSSIGIRVAIGLKK